MRFRFGVLAALLALTASVEASAEPGLWGSESAWTINQDRLELGLLSASRYGLTDRVELRTHPLWFFILPQIEAKIAWLQLGGVRIATQHYVAYPSFLLRLSAKKGTLGLLPEGTEVPHALLLENSVLASSELAPWLLTTAEVGVSIAPREGADLPLLEFPFLYQRLAPLFGTAVPHGSLALEGALGSRLGYTATAEARWFALDGEQTGGLESVWALEGSFRLDYFWGQRIRVSAGVRAAHAEFPIGFRTHVLPTADLGVAL